MLGHQASRDDDAKGAAPLMPDDPSCYVTKCFSHLSLFSKQYTPELQDGPDPYHPMRRVGAPIRAATVTERFAGASYLPKL